MISKILCSSGAIAALAAGIAAFGNPALTDGQAVGWGMLAAGVAAVLATGAIVGGAK